VANAETLVGQHISKAYAKEGALLVLSSSRAANNQLQDIGKECREIGAGEVVCLAGELRNEQDSRKLVDTALTVGTLSLVVFCCSASDIASDENFHTIQSATTLIDAAVPHIKQHGGHISFVSTIEALIPSVADTSLRTVILAGLKAYFERVRLESTVPVHEVLVLPSQVSDASRLVTAINRGDRIRASASWRVLQWITTLCPNIGDVILRRLLVTKKTN